MISYKIVELCDNNGIDDLFYVKKLPESDCIAGNCFSNVQMCIKKFGGTLLMGWSITVRPNIFIEAEAHAIWKKTEDEIIDVTPIDDDSEYTLFSYKEDMLVKKTPSKYIPFTSSELVHEYINLRNQFENIRCSATDDTIQIPATIMNRIIEIDNMFLTKVGVNEKCPCQSGLKYKKCCGG